MPIPAQEDAIRPAQQGVHVNAGGGGRILADGPEEERAVGQIQPRRGRAPPSPQGKYWLLTIPHHCYTPHPHSDIEYSKGQLEIGQGNGFMHWQVVAGFKKKVRLSRVKAIFGAECHAELTRSDAADKYVLKEETRVEGTRFVLIQAIKYLC